ncbi:MAG: ABC transporter ATP-binding protein [Myxococcota bacterium]
MEIIRAENIGKAYQIYERFSHRFAEWMTLGRVKLHNDFYALRNISFRVSAGEAFGVIGENGAGKSTLLRILAGISCPTEGYIEVNGKIATLLDLAAGFKPQFTGRENIKLNCTLMGMSPREIAEKTERIIEFAELDEHIDHKLYTYSTGMAMRLGFAIAANMESDIFLIDEVIAVGDEYFQRKCVDKIEEMLKEGRTIIFVSHNLHAVKNMCSRVLWLEGGTTKRLDSAETVVEEYIGESRKKRYRATMLPHGESEKKASPTPKERRSQGVEITDVRMNGLRKQTEWLIKSGEPLDISVTFNAEVEIEDPVMGAAIFRDDGVYVFGPNTMFDNCLKGRYKGVYTYTCHIPNFCLLRGKYHLTFAIFDKEHIFHYVWLDKQFSFTVVDDTKYDGLVDMEHSWSIREGE